MKSSNLEYIPLNNNQYIEKSFSKNNNSFSIETGYFIFTLMPSLRCSLNCPHCYLSLEQRRNSEIMSIDNLSLTCDKVYAYYNRLSQKNKNMIFYWYGGEPTEMGINYFNKAVNIINNKFTSEDNYFTKHTVLTSLITIDEKTWFPFFHTYCNSHFQSSFDGLMRGKNYVKKWEDKIKIAKQDGLSIGTISVVNHEMLKIGPKETLHYLANLGIEETSFLPFMWNEQNNGKSYDKYAPTMNAWSDFMIELTQEYEKMKQDNILVPEIGQMHFSLSQRNNINVANVAGQTLFLLPNGDFVLPDYKNGYQEYLRKFGNILTDSFESILNSPERKKYLKKQFLKNNNNDCNECDLSNQCVMEFWKENRSSDDCFGGSKYIKWLNNKYPTINIKSVNY